MNYVQVRRDPLFRLLRGVDLDLGMRLSVCSGRRWRGGDPLPRIVFDALRRFQECFLEPRRHRRQRLLRHVLEQDLARPVNADEDAARRSCGKDQGDGCLDRGFGLEIEREAMAAEVVDVENP